ncbi:hypothetical protein GQ457_04G025670 [Hibiscus cannabinus]
MLKGKALIKETEMLEKMQTQAMDSASQALDLYDVSDCISIAAHIKKYVLKKKNCSSFKIAPNVAMPEHKFTAINIKSRSNEQNPETESNKKP